MDRVQTLLLFHVNMNGFFSCGIKTNVRHMFNSHKHFKVKVKHRGESCCRNTFDPLSDRIGLNQDLFVLRT